MNWIKKGKIFDPVDFPKRPSWMFGFAQAPNVLILDELVRIYFCTRPQPDENMNYVSRAAYIDVNRSNLFEIVNICDEPILPLGDLGMFDEFGTYPVSVCRNRERIISVYGGWTRCESVPFNISLGLGESFDGGQTFKKVGPGPTLSHTADEPFVVTSPKLRYYGDTWYLAYTAGKKWFIDDDGRAEIIYKIRLASSPDLKNWQRFGNDIISDVRGSDEAQACPDIFYHQGDYHMFFCHRDATGFRDDKSRSYRLGYAHSTDLMNWSRNDDLLTLDVSESGWDSEMVAYPTVFELDGNIHMIYGGNGNGKTGFGLATLEGQVLR